MTRFSAVGYFFNVGVGHRLAPHVGEIAEKIDRDDPSLPVEKLHREIGAVRCVEEDRRHEILREFRAVERETQAALALGRRRWDLPGARLVGKVPAFLGHAGEPGRTLGRSEGGGRGEGGVEA